jgi:hypothetical protein
MRELLEFYYVFFLFIANALLLLLGYSAFFYFSYRRLRLKGYRPPAAAALILTAGAMGITATVLRKVTLSSYGFFFQYFWIPLLLSAVTMGIFLLVLPSRENRVFGPRQRHSTVLGFGTLISFGLALIGGAAILWMQGGGASLLVEACLLALVVAPTGLNLIRRGQRAKGVLPVEEIPRMDSRNPDFSS